jgi:biopolymer transport protein ExbD
MSAMIDIVFLLLIFFVMTFRIVAQEGEFSFEPTPHVGQSTSNSTALPLHVRLSAADDGALAVVELNGRSLSGLAGLQTTLMELSADGGLGGTKMSLQCDSTLKYEHIIATLDVVTGYRDQAGAFQPLVSKVGFVKSR